MGISLGKSLADYKARAAFQPLLAASCLTTEMIAYSSN
jgi:hypothetical protein